MFKHLKYIDGTSDKFWEIQTDGTTHTVTYGRNGTSGQSKSKTFDSEEACLKDAEKLVTEKTKKGYSEDGTVDVEVTSNAGATTSARKPSASKQQKEEVIAGLKTLIKQGKVTDILPFLEKYSTGNLEVIKKEIRTAKRYWVDYVDLSKDAEFKHKAQYNWGTRGTKEQQRIVKLLALATFSGSDVGTWDMFHELLEQVKNPEVEAILAYAKPNWINAYLLQTIRRNDWMRVQYMNLRYLEDKGYVHFEPELYASAISAFNYNESKKLFSILTEDELAIQRDIPLVFDYETGINNVYWDYNYQNPVNELLWDKVFAFLLEANKIEKEFLLHGALEAQTKNWNINLKSYFRKLIENLQLSDEVILLHQEKFFPLLHTEQGAVINFTVNYLKPYLEHPDFRLMEFLDWAEGIFMRNDVKTALKTLLIQFDKILKKQPEYTEKLLLLAADIFMIADLQLQERTSKFILKHHKEPISELSDKLEAYKGQMMGAIANDLKDLLQADSYSEADILAVLEEPITEQYVYHPMEIQRLNTAIVHPEDWNDIFFKIGEVIGGDDPIQVEILMNAWIQHCDQFPEDYKQQLEPYIKQLSSIYKESAWFSHFSGVFINMYYKPHLVYHDKDRYHNYSKWISIIGDQLATLQRHKIDNVCLPLLSLPTHEPFWIAPTALVQRILAYQEAAVKIDLLDLSIAISRLVREELEGVELLIQQIEDKEIAEVIKYALGFDTHINVQKQSWLKNLIHKIEGKDVYNLAGVWATVARTHSPEGYFEEFDVEPLKDMPFAVQPFRPRLTMEPSYYDAYNYVTKKTEKQYNGDQLTATFPAFQPGADSFLYHKDIFNRGNNQIWSYYLYKADIAYMHSLMPQNTESLSLFLTLAYKNKSEAGGKSTAAYLQEMLYDFFVIDLQSALYLATSMFDKEKEVRAMAVEVLIATIQANRLPIELVGKHLGMLLSSGYGPIGRFAEVLEQCRDISSLHNNALLQVLDVAFLRYTIAEKMPTNFKKIVELYYDLLHKEQYLVSEHVQQVFANLEVYKSLQPILKKIKK